MDNRELQSILIVEDEEDIRKILGIALGNAGGYQLSLCASAMDALDILQTYQPDLILLDVMMPVMDGPTFLSTIRQTEHLKEIPVIFMTAKVQPQEVEQYHAMGVLGVISKPFDPMRLSERLNDMWHSTSCI